MFRKKWLRLFDLIFPRIIFVNQTLKANNLFNLHNFEYFQKAVKNVSQHQKHQEEDEDG